MKTNPILRAGVLLGLALVGWALCGAIMNIGRTVTSLEITLVVHAIAAPLIFAALGWIYARQFAYPTPVKTALIFTGIVIAMDALLVAPFLERSYAMFTSVAGTWLPFVLIFLGAYVGGLLARRQTPSLSVSPR